MKLFVIHLLIGSIKTLKLAVSIVIILTAILVGSTYSKQSSYSPYFTQLNNVTLKITQPLMAQIKLVIPYEFFKQDLSPVILFAILWVFSHILSSLLFRIKGARMMLVYTKNIQTKASENTIRQEKIIELPVKQHNVINTEKSATRKELLKQFVSIKSKLDSMGEEYAFLAISIVDLSDIKAVENKHVIDYDFEHYNRMVMSCLNKNGVIKYINTADGMISCFKTVDNALNAATELLARLKKFNQNDRKIKQELKIRCGINAGFVYIEGLSLGQITDPVIDIASSMQRHAQPNTINLTATAIELLENRTGIHESDEFIDRQQVYVLVL